LGVGRGAQRQREAGREQRSKGERAGRTGVEGAAHQDELREMAARGEFIQRYMMLLRNLVGEMQRGEPLVAVRVGFLGDERMQVRGVVR